MELFLWVNPYVLRYDTDQPAFVRIGRMKTIQTQRDTKSTYNPHIFIHIIFTILKFSLQLHPNSHDIQILPTATAKFSEKHIIKKLNQTKTAFRNDVRWSYFSIFGHLSTRANIKWISHLCYSCTSVLTTVFTSKKLKEWDRYTSYTYTGLHVINPYEACISFWSNYLTHSLPLLRGSIWTMVYSYQRHLFHKIYY